ncbi:unnamed protein product, partial [Rhizoctonia solani]
RLNIALLICDTPILAVQATHGTYLDIFRAHLQKSLESTLESKDEPVDSVQFTLDGYDVVEQLYPEKVKLETHDGIMLTGAATRAYEPLPWISSLLDFIARVTKDHPKIKIFGICFGHQIIARALGGQCVVNEKGWEVGVYDVQLNELGEKIFGRKELRIHQMHRALVPATHIPPGFEVIGTTPACTNQGMVLRYPNANDKTGYVGIHIFTLQGHPEFHESIASKIIDERELDGRMNSSVAADGRGRALLQHDGVSVIGRVMWGIFGVN